MAKSSSPAHAYNIYSPGRGKVGLVRLQRGGLMRDRSGGERGGNTSTTIYTEDLRSIVTVG